MGLEPIRPARIGGFKDRCVCQFHHLSYLVLPLSCLRVTGVNCFQRTILRRLWIWVLQFKARRSAATPLFNDHKQPVIDEVVHHVAGEICPVFFDIERTAFTG